MSGESNALGPLHGIRVLDLTRVLSGPFCTMMLADQGAEVVKVEIPCRGDDARQFGPPFKNGESAFFVSINRNKKSITLNLKETRDVEILKRLVEEADVFVENYRPGVTEKLGIDYETLRAVNPRIIYCSISGFGQSGPYRTRPGYNFTVQAMSGVMRVSGEPGSDPSPVGISLGDIPAGMFAAYAISTALYQRTQTGVGQWVDIAMLDALIALMEAPLARYAMMGTCPPPIGQYNPSITPFGVLSTADTPIVVAVGNDKLWRLFCETMERPELIGHPDYETNALRTQNRESLYPELEETLKRRAAKEWLELFVSVGIPAAPVNTIADVYSDPHVAARGMVQRVEQPHAGMVEIAGCPVRIGDHSGVPFSPAPQLGQHTLSILSEWLDLDPHAVDEMMGSEDK